MISILRKLFSSPNGEPPESIVDQITSRDTHKVWSSSCEIISMSQDREKILPLVDSIELIKERTKGLNMGGAFAQNQRFVDFAIRAIEFHRDNKVCPCCLYLEHAVDPNKESEKKFIRITDTVRVEDKWVDHYLAECTRCKQKFRIIERESHFTWWEWKYA